MYWNTFNPAYRSFTDDCTNFLSQCAVLGGFTAKGFPNSYKNWGYWWYDPSGSPKKGQTRSWTQATALHYFLLNSGRGFATNRLCDLHRGDMIFADWNADGMIDHGMILTYANCTAGWAGMLCAQHTNPRFGKSLRDYQLDEPLVQFYAVSICHN